ncbi:MAG: hypothetical protein ACYC9L_17330, partial [Sulfuricaulis sp.]
MLSKSFRSQMAKPSIVHVRIITRSLGHIARIVLITGLGVQLIACGGSAGTSASAAASAASVQAQTTLPPAPITGAPYITYTDILSGPNTGGENNEGAYLSIFGKNFGGTGL